MEADNHVVRHPVQKGFGTKSTPCGQSPASTGLNVSHAKPGAVLPLKHTATRGKGLPIHATVKWGEGRTIVMTTARSRGGPTVHNTAWDTSMAINQVATLEPLTETNRTVARDLGSDRNDPVARHSSQKSLIKGILCG